MTSDRRLWVLAAAAAAIGLSAQAVAQRSDFHSVEAGITAWQAGDYAAAVANWRPLADRGDHDAQFNLGHAYRLGRGVPRNLTLAEQWYERAARAGHVEAQAMYGMILFQNGRRQEALPFVRRAAEHGDSRAQYVYGTMLFNGDVVERDLAQAWAFMSRAAAQGLPVAQSQLAQIEEGMSAQDRARGTQLAAALAGAPPAVAAPGDMSGAEPLPSVTQSRRDPGRARVAQAEVPASTGAAPQRPTSRPSAPAPASAGGRWRVQLGAFSSDSNARRAWGSVSGRLAGLQPYYVRAGSLIRLQAGPLASRAAAERTCAALRGQACFPVAN